MYQGVQGYYTVTSFTPIDCIVVTPHLFDIDSRYHQTTIMLSSLRFLVRRHLQIQPAHTDRMQRLPLSQGPCRQIRLHSRISIAPTASLRGMQNRGSHPI